MTKVGNLTGAAAAFATATTSYRADAEGDAVPAEQKFKYGLAYYNHARMLDLQVPARLLLRHTARRVKSASVSAAGGPRPGAQRVAEPPAPHPVRLPGDETWRRRCDGAGATV